MGVFLWGQKPKNTNYRISIATKQKTPLFSQRRYIGKYKGGALALTPPKEKGVTDNVSFQEASVRLTTILILIITYIIVEM